MIANPSAAELVARVLFLFGYALLFALAEIEIEGEARLGRAAAHLVPRDDTGRAAPSGCSCAASR